MQILRLVLSHETGFLFLSPEGAMRQQLLGSNSRFTSHILSCSINFQSIFIHFHSFSFILINFLTRRYTKDVVSCCHRLSGSSFVAGVGCNVVKYHLEEKALAEGTPGSSTNVIDIA